MILQALVRYYDALVSKGEMEKPGWLKEKVSWLLEVDEAGAPIRVAPLEVSVQKGNKLVTEPQLMLLPARVKRSSGVASNYLSDNSTYILGFNAKDKPERRAQCFDACKSMHLQLLEGLTHPAAQAVCAFFKGWKPENAQEHPVLKEFLEEIAKGGNIVFYYNGEFVHEIPCVKSSWDQYYEKDDTLPLRRCLVTGEKAPIAVLHPSIKGVIGAQSSGASLVSFNAPAYDSYAPAFEKYGLKMAQGMNAPVSKQAAFAYGAALNYLLSKTKTGGYKSNLIRLDDMSVVFWAEGGAEQYPDMFRFFMNGDKEDNPENNVRDVLARLANGQSASWQGQTLDPGNRFYILGISPNAARLSVRFFLQDTFGFIMGNVAAHQKRLQIVKPSYKTFDSLPMWILLRETANQKSKDKKAPPVLAGELMRAVLNNTPYPAALYEQIEMRIRAEKEITWEKASIIKAYFIKNLSAQLPKEVMEMNLNEETNYQPYVLGRLFSVLEGLQNAANGDTNTTIRDRYFNSACATPAIVFPTLVRLAQAHLKKLTAPNKVYYNKQLTDLIGRMNSGYPKHLSLNDQGVFQIGYYHQTQKRFTKEETDNV